MQLKNLKEVSLLSEELASFDKKIDMFKVHADPYFLYTNIPNDRGMLEIIRGPVLEELRRRRNQVRFTLGKFGVVVPPEKEDVGQGGGGSWPPPFSGQGG